MVSQRLIASRVMQGKEAGELVQIVSKARKPVLMRWGVV